MPRGKGPGRTSRLTPEVADAIVLAVQTGAPLEVSAQSQGIPSSTFWEWMRRGEGNDPDRPPNAEMTAFAQRVRKAEAATHLLLVGTIRRSAVEQRNWEAARAMLKMRWSRYYAERTEVSGAEGGPLAVEIAQVLEGLSDVELATLRRALADGPGDAPGDGGGPEAGPVEDRLEDPGPT